MGLSRTARQVLTAARRTDPVAIRFFKNLSIRAKAFAASLVLLLCLIGIGGNAYLTSDRAAIDLDALTAVNLPKQQSVAKLWVALAVFDAVEKGRMKLDDPVLVTRKDMSVFNQPIQKLLTDQGWLVSTVEQKKRFPDRKKGPCPQCGHQPMIEVSVDLWNCFDLIAEHPFLKQRLYVQVTSASNHATRRNKVLSSFEANLLLLAGARIVIHSWRKDEKLNRWVARYEEITLKDFAQAPHYPVTVREMREIRRRAKAPDLPPGATLKFEDLGEDLPF